MALRNIVTEGDPILRKKCREVDEVTDRIRMILDDMVDTMHDADGVGLAAPQVGIMRRMFVAEPEPEQIYYFVNPKILSQEGEEEGDDYRLVAHVVYDPEAEALSGKSIEEIQAIVDADMEKINDEMPKYKRIKQTYLRTEEFEKTTTQKIKRRTVK